MQVTHIHCLRNYPDSCCSFPSNQSSGTLRSTSFTTCGEVKPLLQSNLEPISTASSSEALHDRTLLLFYSYSLYKCRNQGFAVPLLTVNVCIDCPLSVRCPWLSCVSASAHGGNIRVVDNRAVLETSQRLVLSTFIMEKNIYD